MTLEQHKMYCMGKMMYSTADQRKPRKDPTFSAVAIRLNFGNVSKQKANEFVYTMKG